MDGWEVKKRTRYGLCCTECGTAWRGGSWKPTPQEAEGYRDKAERYGCKVCENRVKVAALPPHHAHHEHNPDWPYPGDVGAPCCAAMQLGAVGPYECAECGESFPCSAAKPRLSADR